MMNLRQYDALRQAQPFKPFRIIVSDGATFDVPHPEFTWRMPNGGLIFVAAPKGDVAQFVDPLHITRFEMKTATGSGRTRKR